VINSVEAKSWSSRWAKKCAAIDVRVRWLGLLLGLIVPLRAAEPAPAADGHVWRHPRELFTANARPLEVQPAALQYSEVRLKLGDEPRWAERDWDDRDWKRVFGFGDFPSHAGIFWIRFRVRLHEPEARLHSGFQITAPAAYELYWDGRKVGHSGVPGMSREEEKAGPLDNLYELPSDLLGPGEHVVAMRMSSYRNGFPADKFYLLLFSGVPGQLERILQQLAIVPIVAAGAMAMLALASVLLWLMAARRSALPWFFALCLSAAALQGTLAARYVAGYTYDWAFPMVFLRVAMAGFTGFFLLAFVVEHFAIPRRRWWLVALAGLFVLILALSPERKSYEAGLMLLAGFVLSLLAAAREAVFRQRRSAWWVVLGVGVGTILGFMDPVTFGIGGFFPKFIPTALCLMIVLAVQVIAERRLAREAQLTSARLEIELLKKNIQPHFLFNTLTAISEVIEQNPAAAVNLIDDLAEEFRALSRMSGEKTVPLGQELELCRTHLRMLGTRMGLACSLDATVPDLEQPVPPALFLTLIENSFVHQTMAAGSTVFALRVTKEASKTRLTFFSPGKIRGPEERTTGGTGLRYVKARLEESFPGRWNFQQHAAPGGWETVIEFGPAG
jgi:hypothetical protein